MKQESLLPGTDAITRSTVESQRYHRGWLVRYKDPAGSVQQRKFSSAAEADDQFWRFVADLRRAAAALGFDVQYHGTTNSDNKRAARTDPEPREPRTTNL